MHPTLREPEMLEILPYGDRPVRAGDVIFFRNPENSRLIVHRVRIVTDKGFVTRGDNCTVDDDVYVTRDAVAGQVIAALRGRRRRTIAGGRRGDLLAHWLRVRKPIRTYLARIFRGPYHTLACNGAWKRLLPPSLRPRTVAFQSEAGRIRCMLIGRRIIGRRDDARGVWQISFPFRMFVEEAEHRRR